MKILLTYSNNRLAKGMAGKDRCLSKWFAALCGALAFCTAETLCGQDAPGSGLKTSPLFSDYMVLQRDIPVPVWGTSAPGDRVSVRFKGQQKVAVADSNGAWRVRLEPLTASAKPETLTVTGQTGQLVFSQVLVGEVWLCSGQSNMEFSFREPTLSDEIKGADYPQIRLTNGEKWSSCTADTLLPFSCVGYYFGLNLWKELQVPVGLINISRGCSSIETWMTPDSLKAHASLVDQNGCNLLDEMNTFQRFYADYDHCPDTEKERVFLEHCKGSYVFARGYLGEDGKPRAEKYRDILWHMSVIKPTHLFRTRIAAVVPFGIKGVIWYQGETNIGDPQYALKQQLLIEGWRTLWQEGDFPFYLVQIAPFKGYPKLPDFWLQQYEAASKVPQSGMISTVDIGDLNECHPKNKRDVGLRLALLALRDAYGRKDIVASGPTYRSMSAEGANIRVTFEAVGKGLSTKDGRAPKGFEVAGADRIFVKAEAAIQGGEVTIASPVGSPAYVRYAWDCQADSSLCNKEGFPAFPFNTAEPFFQRQEK